MGGLVAFIGLRLAGLDLGGGPGLDRVYRCCQLVGVALGSQSGLRHFDESRVAQVFGAVGVGQLHRLGQIVDGLRAVGAVIGQRIAFQQIQDLDDVDAAGAGGRHGHHLVAAVAAADRRALFHLVAGEVSLVDQAAVARHFRHDLVGDAALIKGFWPLFRDQAQRLSQIALHQLFACAQRAAVAEKHRAAAVPSAQIVFFHFQHFRQRLRHREALLRQLHRRSNHLGQRQAAPALLGVSQPGHRAGHAHRQVGVQRPAVNYLALSIQIHVAAGLGRRDLAEIQRNVAAALGVVQNHKAAAAQVAGVGQRHRQRKAHGHRGVYRVAALAQDVQAHLGGQALLGGHHAVASVDRVENIVVVIVFDLRRRRRAQRQGRGVEAQAQA